MKKYNYKIGDTVLYKGKQGIVEAFHGVQAAIFMVEEKERYLVNAGRLQPCKDKYDKMEKAAV